MIVILLSGKAESGKDTFAKVVCDIYKKFGYIANRYAFADAVKDTAFDIGWDGEKDERGRKLLQWLGDGAREYDPMCWIKKLHRELAADEGTTDIAIVTDARYQNEITYIKERFADCYSVRIVRPFHSNSLTDEQRSHPSECDLDFFDFDFYVKNDDLEQFKDRVIRVMNEIIEKVEETSD